LCKKEVSPQPVAEELFEHPPITRATE